MANISSSAGNFNTNVVTTPTVVNFDTGAANIETSYAFPANTKRFTLTNRGAGILKCNFTAGQTGTTWFTIAPGTSYGESEISVNANLVLYIQSPIANQILEIVSWS